jgi:hypothetical protein
MKPAAVVDAKKRIERGCRGVALSGIASQFFVIASMTAVHR